MACILFYPFFVIYSILNHFLQKLFPKKTFNLEIKSYRDGCSMKQEEWDIEQKIIGETLLFEGSNPDGTIVYVEITGKEKCQIANLFVTYKSQTFHGQFCGKTTNNRIINCGPLHLEMRTPFRKWRITFKGHLKNILNEEDEFISFAGYFKPTSDARYFYSNYNLRTFMNLIMKNPFKFLYNCLQIKNLRDSKTFYQDGEYCLEFSLGDNQEILRLRGLRTRHPSNLFATIDQFYTYLQDGNRLIYTTKSLPEYKDTSITHGYIVRGDRKVKKIELDDRLALDLSNQRLLNFKVKGFPAFGLRKDSIISEFTYTNGNDQVVSVKRVKVNSGLSTGIALVRVVRETLQTFEEPEFEHIEEYKASKLEKEHSVLPFTHRACQDKLFAGGKGANLARLTTIENGFTVPGGVVITTTAFENHLKQNEEIKKLVQSLSNKGTDLESQLKIGERIQECLKHSMISADLLDAIQDSGFELRDDMKYAVRSSAVGEDGADLSSAGQLESSLNVDRSEIGHKIIDCWCSNYRREVISYRRNYGQIINPPMAVVIQEMRVNGVAGVMFTCDPVRNDDSRIIMNAIKGIGEDIVSGVVTPDEIVVVKKTWTFDKPEACCMNEDEITKLARIGIFLENTFGKAQDVEFVMRNGNVYIVQTRDVTGREAESVFELETEYDTGTLTDKEVFTTANVGEVLGYPMTPFELTALPPFEKAMSALVMEPVESYISRHTEMTVALSKNRLIFNAGETFLRLWKTFEKERLMELAMAGTEILTPEMFTLARQRYLVPPAHFDIKRMITMFYGLFLEADKTILKIRAEKDAAIKMGPKKKASDYTFNELLSIFEAQSLVYAAAMDSHSRLSVFSSFTYIIVAMLVRGTESGSLTSEMLSDFAELFSNCSNVISADVPVSLKKIGKAIKEDGLAEEFLKLEDDDCISLIENKGEKSKEELDNFKELHGHRGIRELYINGISWGDNIASIVPNVKNIVSSETFDEAEKVERDLGEVIEALSCKPEGIRKTFMKFFAKQTHIGVINREGAKTCVVRCLYEVRKTVRLIQQKFVDEGYLTDPQLFFFFEYDELKEFYATRNAKLIARAQRRLKIFPNMVANKFEHVIFGPLDPISESNSIDYTSLVSLKGTVVCRGKVIARARVAKNFEEAKATQPGEILITHCTDICWSPFFPVIKGIVTEIGGLLSHGAVVAREYGLPSLIAVEHATDVFSTGDLVELNTDKGTISKIEEITQE